MISLATLPLGKSSLAACLACGARSQSFCNATESETLARLAGLATVIEVAAGCGFIQEDEAADHFFNINPNYG